MAFSDREKSEYMGQPYELFRAAYGVVASDIALYTTHSEPVTRNSEVYQPLPIDHDDIIASPGLDTAVMNVRVPEDCSLARQYRLYPPAQPIALNIWRGHVGEPPESEVLIWTGRILWCTFNEDFTATLECQPINGSLKRVGLRRHYQYMCPHILYEGKTCKANKGANGFTATIVSVSNNKVVIESVGLTIDDPRLIGGTLEWVYRDMVNVRTITGATMSGDGALTELTLIGPATGLTTSIYGTVYRGCGRTLADCRDVFNNANNFGGHPYIPLENPTNSTSKFY